MTSPMSENPMPPTIHQRHERRAGAGGSSGVSGGGTLSSVVVVLLICLVLVVVAIVVVIRLLLAELGRSAAYRHAATRDARLDYRGPVNLVATKAPVSASRSAARRPGEPPHATPAPYPVDQPAYVEEGGLLVDIGAQPRQREVGRVTKVVWWRRLRSGTALVLLVALLGIATAALVGAIALFFAFVLEQAIN